MIIAHNSFKNQEYSFSVGDQDTSKRLDKFLFDNIKKYDKDNSVSRVRIQELIQEKHVKRNSEIVSSSSHKLKPLDIITIYFPENKKTDISAQNIPLDIVFEDEHMLVINKQAGLTTHPGAGNYDNTLVNALLFHCKDTLSGIRGVERPGIVHRLDKDTSGLMVVAKTDAAHHSLAEQIQERTFERKYYAFIKGVLSPISGYIEGNIAPSTKNRLKMAVVKNGGKYAKTNYETIETYCDDNFSLVECKLDTGRTHQIRVHLSSKGHSLIGDSLYSCGRNILPKTIPENVRNFVESFPRHALHSYSIKFSHPISLKEMVFKVDLPNDLKELKKVLL